jgi:2-succinyl-5-enolpyruvyl-6-hydroxy-3-cyclohexene-1-carboxylate synthase
LFAAHARGMFSLPADASEAHARDIGRRAAAHCLWPRAGPVHVNVAFREPLVAARPEHCETWSPRPGGVRAPGRVTPDLGAIASVAARLGSRRGAILAGRLSPGDPSATAIVGLAQALDCAVIADPLSGLRAGYDDQARILCAADAFLRNPAQLPPDWLIRVGRPAVSAIVEAWGARCPEAVLLALTPDWTDPLRTARTVVLGDPAASLSVLTASVERAGLRAAPWDALDQAEAGAREDLAALEAPPAEAGLVQAVAELAPADTPVFVSGSLVVRDFDSFFPRRAAPLALYANRGVSGIDGNLSTAAGIAAQSGRSVLAVIGDLALFHDLNALALCRGQPIVVVVVNNGGGAIFGQLPQAALPEFEALWLTPPALELEKAAGLFDLEYARLSPGARLRDALSAALRSGRPTLLEFVVDRHASRLGRQAWWRACSGGSRSRGELNTETSE